MKINFLKMVAACAAVAALAGCGRECGAGGEMVARVKMTDGGPQIFVNGKAVPPRMYWGRPGAGRRDAPEGKWNAVEMAFASPVLTDRASMHFRFQRSHGGAIRLRNIRMVEDGKEVPSQFDSCFASEESFKKAWNVWDPRKAAFTRTSTNGTCEVRFTMPPEEANRSADYHFYSKYFTVKPGVKYALRFDVQGEGGSSYAVPNVYKVGMDGYHESIVTGEDNNTLLSTAIKAAAVGVDFVSYGIPGNIWGENGDDYRAFDALTRELIAANPKVRLIPRVNINAPKWWLEKNPDHRMQMAPKQVKASAGKRHSWSSKERPDMAAVSSRLYRKAALDYIARFCRHMMKEFPENFAGIHPTGQNTHEWFYFDSWSKMNGYDPQTVAAFREYLGDPAATVPTEDERMADCVKRHLLDGKTQKRIIEFNRFQQLEMTDFVAEIARTCRRETEGKKLVVIFYGYAHEFSSHGLGPANSGHYGMENLIKRADGAIDILCSPISYSDRRWPGSTPNMSCGETVMRNGILWLNEDDSRTHLDVRGEPYVQEGSRVDLWQTRQILLRNTAWEAVHGFGSWWMDLPGWGWYDSAELWNEQKKLNPLEAKILARKTPFVPEVALIQDEESMLHVRPRAGGVNSKMIGAARRSVHRSGVSHGQYLLFDALENPLKAKLQIFQSCWNLSDAEVEALMRQKSANPAWRVWCWAAGAQNEEGEADLERMGRLTGFKIEPHDLTKDGRLSAKATEEGMKRGLLKDKWYGTSACSQISFKVADAKPEEIWARYPNGDVAIAVRQNGNGGDIFLGVPELSEELVHAFAEVTGVHSFIGPETVGKVAVQATRGACGDGFGVVQAQEEVSFDLKLPKSAKLLDATTGAVLGEGTSVPLKLKEGETKVFTWR